VASETTNYQLKKPDPADFYDVADLNGNMDKLDAALHALETGKAPASHTHTPGEVGAAAASHTHAAGDITSGALAVAQGGTGATTAAAALTNLGAAPASHNHSAANITSGTLGVARGGTGKASWTANRLIYPSATTTLAQLAFPAAAGSVLRQGTSGAPYWSTPAQLLADMGGLKLATGSYVGTGTYGANSPTKITFPGAPILWGIPNFYTETQDYYGNAMDCVMVGKTGNTYGIGNNVMLYCTWSGNTISMWCTNNDSAYAQYNSASTTYYWFCFYK
jgi:hypothetical protein